LRDEFKSIEADLVKLKKPSANLTDKKIETIIKFLRELPKLYKAFNKKEKKQFLRWFIEKVWIKDKKLDGFDHTEPFKVLTDLRLVRITDLWLPEPEIIRAVINELILAFSDYIQVGITRLRLNEINKLSLLQ